MLWYEDEYERRYQGYGISFPLGKYLAAGIPVIVPSGISNQSLIERNGLGLVVNSQSDAKAAVEAMDESEYQEYVQRVGQFAPGLRNGYFTKRCLISTVQAFYRNDTDRISTSTKICQYDNKFVYAVVNESYGEKMGISWEFNGKADGFLIYGSSGRLLYNTHSFREHYFQTEKKNEEDIYYLKAYIEVREGKLIVAETEPLRPSLNLYDKAGVSLIIPAYNAEDYIVRSIDTALAQTFTEIELIVVDDGSTDTTPHIIDWYAQRYPNVKAIHQENRGAAEARNTGIKAAKGEYINFLDVDDMIRPSRIAKLYQSIRENDCDIAVTSAYWLTNRGYEKNIHYSMRENDAVTAEEFIRVHFNYETPYGVVLWNKLYRAFLLKDHLLPPLQHEDEAWTPYILSYADRVCYLDDPSYEYDRTSCKRTLLDSLMEKPVEERFTQVKESTMFYMRNGNPAMRGLLKEHAKQKLLGNFNHYQYDEFEKLWRYIESNF